MTSKRDSIRFTADVSPGTTETLDTEITEDATVEQVSVRMYQGPELALEMYPFVVRDNSKTSLVRFVGQEFIAGDNDYWTFPISEPVKAEDTIGIDVTNHSDEWEYRAVCDMTLDTAGGTDRVFSTIRGIFS